MYAILISVLVLGNDLPRVDLVPFVQTMDECLQRKDEMGPPVNNTGNYVSFTICYPLDAVALDGLRLSAELTPLRAPTAADTSPPQELIQALNVALWPASVGTDARPVLGRWRLPTSDNVVGFACGPIERPRSANGDNLPRSWRGTLMREGGILTFVIVQPYFMTFAELLAEACD